MHQISLIIPIYNCEKSLENTFKCIKEQVFRDFEVILVDDGSKDSSGILCDRFASENENVKVIHQKNVGASAARNTGLSSASGRWIVFMDADDEIGVDYLKSLWEARIENGVVVAGFYEKESGIKRLSVDFGHQEYSIAGNNLFDISITPTLYGHPSPIAKIFDGDIIRKYTLRFNPNISICEDLLFWMEFIIKADNIRIIPPINYVYLKDDSYLTRQKHPYRMLEELAIEFIRLMNLFSSRFGKVPSTVARKHAASRAMSAIFAVYDSDLSRAKRLKVIQEMLESYGKIIKKDYTGVSLVMKLKKWLLFNNLFLFDVIQKR